MNWFIQLLADWVMIPTVLVAAIALLVYVPHRQKFTVYSRILVAGLTANLVARLMATVYQPTGLRPFELQGVQAGASYLNNPGFPSDHMLFITAITYAVAYGTRKRWLIVLCAVVALVVGIGRVLALVHTPLDIFGGFVAASVGALWYLDTISLQKNKT